MKNIKTLGVILIILNLLDAIFTWIAVSNKTGKELNPIMLVFLNDGPWTYFIVKLCIPSLLILYVLSRIKREDDKTACTVFSILTVIFSVVVCSGALSLLPT